MYYLQLPVFLLRNLSTKYRAIKERAAEDKQYTIHMYCSHSQYSLALFLSTYQKTQ